MLHGMRIPELFLVKLYLYNFSFNHKIYVMKYGHLSDKIAMVNVRADGPPGFEDFSSISKQNQAFFIFFISG